MWLNPYNSAHLQQRMGTCGFACWDGLPAPGDARAVPMWLGKHRSFRVLHAFSFIFCHGKNCAIRELRTLAALRGSSLNSSTEEQLINVKSNYDIKRPVTELMFSHPQASVAFRSCSSPEYCSVVGALMPFFSILSSLFESFL